MEREPVNPHEMEIKDDYYEHLQDTRLLSDNLVLAEEAKKEFRENLRNDLLNKKKEKHDRKAERRAQTLRDARNRCRRYAIANFTPSDCFITLTYAEHITNVEEADKHFKAFIRKFKKYTGQTVKYLAVREFTKKGRVHFHLVTDWKHPAEYVDNEEYIKTLEREVGEKVWGRGFVDIKPMNKAKSNNKKYNNKPVDNIGAYLTKYMTKELDDSRLQGHKIYLNSKGLEKPLEYTGEEAEAIIQAYKLDIKKEVFTNSYESEYLGKITYKEYNLNR